MGDNDDIFAGDKAIIFKKTKNGRQLVLNRGDVPQPGNIIGIHPTNIGENNRGDVTHGLSHFEVGDQVIIQKLKTGEEAAFKPAERGAFGCINVDLGQSTMHGASNDDESRQYYAYTINLSEPFYRQDHDMNIYMAFRVKEGWAGFQGWYPWGGVWLGFSEVGGTNWEEDWAWCPAGGDPYMVIRGGPSHYCGNTPGNHWCLPDALNVNSCNSNPELGGNCGAPVGMDTPINFVHVHISVASTLMWDNHTYTDMSMFKVCRGNPVEVDPCPYLTGSQKCP